MSNTLTYGAITIALPDDLSWSDEYAWSPVLSQKGYSITGALLIESSAKQAGRSITLTGDESSGWAARSTVDLLKTARAIPGQVFALVLRGVTYTVMFDQTVDCLTASPVVDYSDPIAADFYSITLTFIATS